MNLEEIKLYGINEEEDFVGCFYVEEPLDKNIIHERNGEFKDNRGNKIDIYIKEACIHLRDHLGNICRIRLRSNEYQRDKYEKNGKGHKLDKDEEEAFRNYMHGKVPNINLIRWERLASDWNDSLASQNSGTAGLVDISKGCPSYKNIKEPK